MRVCVLWGVCGGVSSKVLCGVNGGGGREHRQMNLKIYISEYANLAV